MATLNPKTETEWQADQDARTLMDYHAIKKSPTRLRAARKVLKAKISAEQKALKSTG